MNHLLILTYAMDSQHPIFPHQISVAKDLSAFWDRVTVITYEVNDNEVRKLPNNVVVYDLKWKQRSNFAIFLVLYRIFLSIFVNNQRLVVFSYMTETLSAMLCPFTKLMRVRHVLWYAHTSFPKRLRWCHFWVDKIVTSTRNSCPIIGKKVIPIGQSVDHESFRCTSGKKNKTNNETRLIYVGRLDPSKNIIAIINVFSAFAKKEKASLHLIGAPTDGNLDYFNKIKIEIERQNLTESIHLHGSRNQTYIQSELCASDVFIHAFEGSLDKSLVEAVFCKIFVLSYNDNFINEFGSLYQKTAKDSVEAYLSKELCEYKLAKDESLLALSNSRYSIALERHSRVMWLNKLAVVLNI